MFGEKLESTCASASASSSSISRSKHAAMMIVGNKNSGKSNLAFAYAYDVALRGGEPLFICNKLKIESQPPLSTKDAMLPRTPGSASRMTPRPRTSSDIHSRIMMKYISSSNDLKMLMMGLHNFEPKPTTIVIEDFSTIIDPLNSSTRRESSFLDMCLLVGAFVNDAVHFLNEHGHTTSLLITDNCGELGFLNIMSRVTPAVLFLRQTGVPITANLVFKKDITQQVDQETSDSTTIVLQSIVLEDNGMLAFTYC